MMTLIFAGYATLPRSVEGLSGAPEWDAIQRLLPDLNGKSIIDLVVVMAGFVGGQVLKGQHR